MSGKILPVFDHIQSPELATASSEPFLELEKYVFISPIPVVDTDEPIAIGVAYITEGAPEYGFALSNTVAMPLHEADAFINAYDFFIGDLHKRADDIIRRLPGLDAVFSNEAMSMFEKTKEARLLVAAGFAILRTQQQPGLNNVIIVPKKAAYEMPLENRQRYLDSLPDPEFTAIARSLISEHLPDPNTALKDVGKRITTNSIAKQYGAVARACTRFLPVTKVARKCTSSESRVGNFFELPRKDRRAKLSTERKQAR